MAPALASVVIRAATYRTALPPADEAGRLADATGVVHNRAYYFTSRDFVSKNADVLKIAIRQAGRGGARRGPRAS